MKAVLIIPARPYLFVQKAFPYLGVMMVSSALKAEGHEVKIIDFADGDIFIDADDGDVFVDADWYGIFATSSDWDEVIRVRNYILHYKPDAKIMVGGPHATYNTLQCREHFDYVSVGDGEISAIDIIKHVGEGTFESKSHLPLVSHGLLDDIDKFHPDRNAVDLWDYEFFVGGIQATSIITSLSCAYGKCDFCSRPPGNYNNPRYHSAEWCIDEIKQIEEIGFKALMLYDDEFFTYPKRDREIIEYLGESKIEAWRCFARSDYSLKHPNLIRKAAESGLKEVLIGIESGSQVVLDAVNKGTTVYENLRAVKMFNRLGIKVKCTMIIGLPSESLDTLRETWRWCEEAEEYVDDWDFTTYVPLPGSKVYEHSESYNLGFNKINSNAPYKAMNMESKQCPISTSELTFPEIEDARKFLEDRFKHGESFADIIFMGDE